MGTSSSVGSSSCTSDADSDITHVTSRNFPRSRIFPKSRNSAGNKSTWHHIPKRPGTRIKSHPNLYNLSMTRDRGREKNTFSTEEAAAPSGEPEANPDRTSAIVRNLFAAANHAGKLHRGYEHREPSPGRAPGFGVFQDTHGWVECESKSFPGMRYFFNVRSHCTTWTRPTPADVRLPFFHPRPRVHDDASYGVQDPPMIVSDDEEERSPWADDLAGTKDFASRGNHAEILARLYNEPSRFLEYLNCTNGGESLTDEGNSPGTCFESPGDGESVFCATDFIETELLLGEDEPDEGSETDGSSCSDSMNRLNFYARPFNINERENPEGIYSVPRLHEIRTHDLLIIPSQNNQEGGIPKEAEPMRKVIKRGNTGTLSNRDPQPRVRKIVCEMYGTQTINYDPVAPEQEQGQSPPRTTRTERLSDSNVSFHSALKEKKRQTSFEEHEDILSKIPKLVLSNSSSSSPSSSASSSSSSSSSASRTSSSSSSSTSSTSSSSSSTSTSGHS